jgi:NAD(P)-dependent dehydrogenase (short-subunit alcohol dehydrogenase family)
LRQFDGGSQRLRLGLGCPVAPTTTAQLAAPITFLLSDDGTYISGTILASDGGWSAL